MNPAKKQRKLGTDELFAYAVKSLAARSASSGDLAAKLRRRASLASDVPATIARLKEIGYLDDKRFAETFAAARVENDGFGQRRVMNDLRAKRIGGTLAEKAVERAMEGRTEGELIEAYIDRRMPDARGTLDQKKLASAYRKLLRAGFATAAILQALKKRAAQPEFLENVPEEEPADLD